MKKPLQNPMELVRTYEALARRVIREHLRKGSRFQTEDELTFLFLACLAPAVSVELESAIDVRMDQIYAGKIINEAP